MVAADPTAGEPSALGAVVVSGARSADAEARVGGAGEATTGTATVAAVGMDAGFASTLTTGRELMGSDAASPDADAAAEATGGVGT